MKATLTEAQLWRGVLYPAGDREIPDDLAIALNLKPATPAAELPDVLPLGNTESTPAPQSDAVHGSTSSTGSVQGTKRRVKRG